MFFWITNPNSTALIWGRPKRGARLGGGGCSFAFRFSCSRSRLRRPPDLVPRPGPQTWSRTRSWNKNQTFPKQSLQCRGSHGVGKGPWEVRGRSALNFDQEKCILGGTCSRHAYPKQQVASSNIIFAIENHHFLVQMVPEASWPPDVSAESLEARIPQPGVLSQAS